MVTWIKICLSERAGLYTHQLLDGILFIDYFLGMTSVSGKKTSTEMSGPDL